jgi:hypothetical protein
MIAVAIGAACILTVVILYLDYYYLAPHTASTEIAVPVIESISPDHGSEAGGTELTLTGRLFDTDCIVYVGDELATDVVRVNSTTVTCIVPASTTGTGPVSVKLVNVDDQGYTFHDYTYD